MLHVTVSCVKFEIIYLFAPYITKNGGGPAAKIITGTTQATRLPRGRSWQLAAVLLIRCNFYQPSIL